MENNQKRNEIVDNIDANKTNLETKQDEKLNIICEDEIKKLQNELQELKKQNKELCDNNLRLIADNVNNHKRLAKNFEDQKNYVNEKFLKEILPILDSLEEILKSKKIEDDQEENPLIEGVKATVKIFEKFLEKQNVSVINPVNELFDPSKHHVMSMVKNDDKENNYITNVMQKGYMLKQRLLRPALVTINQKN